MREVIFFVVGAFLGFVILVGVGYRNYHEQILPRIQIAGRSVAGLTQSEAIELLKKDSENYSVEVVYGENVWIADEKMISLKINETVETAYMVGREWREWRDLIMLAQGGVNLSIKHSVNVVVLEELIEEMRPAIEVDLKLPTLSLEDNEVQLSLGEDGFKIDEEQLKESVRVYVGQLDQEAIVIPVEQTLVGITEEEQALALIRGEELIGDKLTLVFEDDKFVMSDEELLRFLSVGGENVFSRQRVTEYVKSLDKAVERVPQDAKFLYTQGKVEEFAPSKDGIELKVEDTVLAVEAAMAKLVTDSEAEVAEIVVTTTSPKITTEQVNELGITERIGRAESFYKGSISARVHNVGWTAEKLNGTLIPPGEEFSFNGTVGDISRSTGFLPAYIISGGRTVLGDGGGVCQDSTTMFRVAMDAGLPITERWAHSYRVGYYEQNAKPGFDATVYSPSKDFKFLNDTGSHILIQTTVYETERRLVFELYGTSDGRTSYVSEARVWDVTPPPPALYQDDPTLAQGVTKQVDWSAWGAKSSFDYRVEKDGEVAFAKTYYSTYRPWQNVFLVGTKTE